MILGKAETCALPDFFRREEWLEHPLHGGAVHAAAAVAHADTQVLPPRVARRSRHPRGARLVDFRVGASRVPAARRGAAPERWHDIAFEFDRAALRTDRISRVDAQIHQDLDKLSELIKAAG